MIVTNTILEIKPFHLYHECDESYLDAVHALLCWIKESRIEDGFIFRKVLADDRVNILENKLLVSALGTRLIFRVRMLSWIIFAVILSI
jgi:hypothetical protein